MNLLIIAIILHIIFITHQQAFQYDDSQAQIKSKFKLQESLDTVRSKLIHVSLIGSWKLTKQTNFNINKKKDMINELNNKNQIYSKEINFIDEKSNENQKQTQSFLSVNQQGQPNKMYIQLYNGKYYSDDTIVLQLDVYNLNGSKKQDKNYQNNLWQAKQKFITCILIRNREVMAKISMSASYKIYTNIKPNTKLNQTSQIIVELTSKTFNFYAKYKPITNQYHRLVNFSMLFTLIFIIITIYNFKKQIKSVYNISQFMIVQTTVFILLCNFQLIYFCLQKIDTNLKIVVICGALNIITSLFFLRNYEGVFKNYYQMDRGQTQANRLRYSRSLLINKFAIILSFIMGYTGMVYMFHQSHNFWIFQSYIFISLQIYYSYSVGGKGGMSYLLLLTLIAIRFPYFYYKFNSPELTRQNVNIGQMVQFYIVHIILITFIILQKIFGSRFIVPKELIPHLHQYLSKYNRDNQLLNEQCTICLEKLKDKSALNAKEEDKEEENEQQEEQMQEEDGNQIDDSIASSSNVGSQLNATQKQNNQKRNQLPTVSQPNVSELVTPQIEIMITPCNHKFHNECLLDWMQQKLTCPNCRKDLPPSQNQRNESYCF